MVSRTSPTRTRLDKGASQSEYDTETVPIIPTSVPFTVHLHVTPFSRSYCCRTAPHLPCEFWEMYVHRSVRVNTISFFLEYKIMLKTGCHNRLTAFIECRRANIVTKANIPHGRCHRHMHTLYRICYRRLVNDD